MARQIIGFIFRGPGIIPVLVLLFSGCASRPPPPAAGESFIRLRRELSPPWDSIALESIRVICLLEDYRAALESGGAEDLYPLLSPDFSSRGLDRDAWLLRKEEEQFRVFGALETAVEGIRIDFTFDRLLPWLRQEAFDWIGGPRATRPLASPYRLTIGYGSEELVIRVPGEEEKPARGGASRLDSTSEGGERAVTVTAAVDSFLNYPRARLSMEITVSGELVPAAGGDGFAYRLRERRVLGLRKEEAGWRIISRED